MSTDNNTIFQTPADNGATVFDQLVGEGKKFSDQESLAKSKLASDEHIAKLEEENSNLRTEIDKRTSVQDQLKNFVADTRTNNSQSTPPNNQGATQENANVQEVIKQVEQDSSLTPEQVQELVAETLANSQREATKSQNLNTVAEKLKATWGDNFVAQLTEKTKELGVSPSFLDSVAAQSPQAALKLLGVEGEAAPPVVNANTPPQTQVRPAVGDVNPNVRNAAYYENLRKNDPKTYNSTKVQVQRHNDAIAMGEAFFKK